MLSKNFAVSHNHNRKTKNGKQFCLVKKLVLYALRNGFCSVCILISLFVESLLASYLCSFRVKL